MSMAEPMEADGDRDPENPHALDAHRGKNQGSIVIRDFKSR